MLLVRRSRHDAPELHDDIFKQYLVEEFVEDYQEGLIGRREALRRLAAITGSPALAAGILAACDSSSSSSPPAPTAPEPATQPSAIASTQPSNQAQPPQPPQPAQAAQAGVTVSEDDPGIVANALGIPGDGFTLLTYLARPQSEGQFPIILVCHENRGLNDHIRDVTRRLAKAGYVGLAVDLLAREGGSDKVDSVPAVLANTPPTRFVADFQAALRHAQTLPFVHKEQVGMVGFCFGGGVTWRCATQMPEIRAAAPFYGPNPPLEDVSQIKAAVLAVYGEQDQRINRGIEAIEGAMQQNNKVFEKMIYTNAGHAFHNDTGPRYNPEAAHDAWAKTLAWFARHVTA